MKWAGRVLLIVLIASTLFVAKQNDFQTETAFAQTGSTRNLTLNLNDIEVRVVKNDNSSRTTAGSAVIDSQTTAVYFNKVKVTNNSNQDVYFRITAQLYYGTIPGPCAIAGGISCAPPNQYRIVTPGQTLTLPDNTFLLPSNMFSFLSGQYPFQTLALQGINKADLNFILSEAGYASTNVTKAQILKWSAVRVKLQNGAGVPVGNKRVGLFKEGEANTQPPPDQWRSGNTNSTGQVAMALLDPLTAPPLPPMTYTTRYQDGPNPQNYIDLPPPVVVTGADLQDLTYTICDGGTGGQGFLVERARAQAPPPPQQCLPDLVIDTSQMIVERKDINNPQVMSFGSTPALIGDETETLVAKNLKIKNIGQGTAKGTANISSNSFISTSFNDPPITVNLPPGSSVTLPAYTGHFRSLQNGVGRDWLYKDNLKVLALSGKNQLDIEISLNYYPGQGEPSQSNVTNDKSTISNFLRWPEIRVTVVSGKDPSSFKPIVGAVVAFVSPGDPGGIERTKSITDTSGFAYKPITLSPRNGAKTYTITVYIGGKVQGLSQQAVISDYSLYDKNAVMSGIIIIDIKLFIDIPDAKDFKPTNGGAITLNRVEGSPAESIGGNTSCSMTVPAKEGVALFDPGTFPCLTSGTYELLPSSFVFKNPDNEVANFNWPEPNRSYPFDNFTFSTGDVVQTAVRTKLPYSCEPNQVARRTLEICYTDESIKISQTKTIVSPIVTSVFGRLTSWAKYPPKDWNKVIIGYSSDKGAIAYYEYNKREQITGIDRYMLKSSDTENRNTIVHEIFHMLDNFYRPGGSYIWDFLTIKTPLYKQSINDQLDGNQAKGMTSATGSQLWDIVSYNGAYNLNNVGGYDAYGLGKNLLRRGDGHLVEALAEELSTVCIYQQAVVNRLNNINTVWRDKTGQNPPLDLAVHVTNVKNRMQGIFIDASNVTTIVPEMAAWYQQCLVN